MELFKSDWYDISTDSISGKTRKQFDREHTLCVFDLGISKTSKRASSAFTFNAKYRPAMCEGGTIILSNPSFISPSDVPKLFENVIFDLTFMRAEIDHHSLCSYQFNTLFGGYLFINTNGKIQLAWDALLKTQGFRPMIRMPSNKK